MKIRSQQSARIATGLAFALILASCANTVPKKVVSAITPSPSSSESPSLEPSASLGENPPHTPSFDSFFFLDADHGWAASVGCEADCGMLIYGTTNGGRSWVRLGVDPGDGHERDDVRFSDARNGWMVGSELAVTRDGGKTWAYEQQHPTHQTDTVAIEPVGASVWRFDTDRCDEGSTEPGCRPKLIESSDAGRHWKTASAQPSLAGDRVELIRAGRDVAWVTSGSYGKALADDRAIVTTVDGGHSWTTLPNPCAGSPYDAFGSLLAVSPADVWLSCLADAGAKPGHPRRLFRSSDGGRHWIATGPTPTVGTGFQWALADASSVWISLPGAGVYSSNDAGRSWRSRLKRADNSAWSGVYFFDPKHGWVAYDDVIYRTIDGGVTWTTARLPKV